MNEIIIIGNENDKTKRFPEFTEIEWQKFQEKVKSMDKNHFIVNVNFFVITIQ